MNLRNIPHSNGWTIEFEVAQQMPNHHHLEPYILHGGSLNFPQLSSHQMFPPPGSIAYFDFYHLPENHDGTAIYSVPQYAHHVQPATNLELGIPTPSNYYNPYLNPAIGRTFSVPQNCDASSAQVDGYGTHAVAPDGFRGLSKRNIAEGFVGNVQYLNAPSAPSPSMPPLNAFHFDGGVAVVDACFPYTEYRGNYFGQSFQPPAGPNAVGDGSSSFDPPPMSSYYEVSNSFTASSSETGNGVGQRFHGGASTNRAPMLHDVHHLQNAQGTRGYDLNYHIPDVATSSRHYAVQHGSINHTQQGPELVPPPPGIRIYRSHRGGTPEGVNLRLLPEEGLAILEFPDHHEMEMESPIDHHREMRLDIDYMSYEELLALSEHIGNVDTGLSEEAITSYLKTRVYRSCMTSINLEELPRDNEINDSCIICQEEYKDGDYTGSLKCIKMVTTQEEYKDGDYTGSLKCGHEYHVECLKKWLRVKNACPICKSLAVDVERKDKYI